MVEITHRTMYKYMFVRANQYSVLPIGCQVAKNFVKIVDKIELIISSQWECCSNSNVHSDVGMRKGLQ